VEEADETVSGAGYVWPGARDERAAQRVATVFHRAGSAQMLREDQRESIGRCDRSRRLYCDAERPVCTADDLSQSQRHGAREVQYPLAVPESGVSRDS
jgi:hypothetical protein